MRTSRPLAILFLAFSLSACSDDAPAKQAGPNPLDPNIKTPDTEFVTIAGGSDFLSAVVRGPDRLLAVGDGAQVSVDGEHWFHQSTGFGSGRYLDVIWDDTNSQYIAADADLGVSTSKNGEDWYPPSPAFSGDKMQALARSGPRVIVVGLEGTAFSKDGGKTWTAGSSPAEFHDVAWSAGLERFVAVGKTGAMYSTSDAQTWTAISSGTTLDLHSIREWAGKLFVGGDQETILSSVDGASWDARHAEPASQFALTAIAHSGTRFVAVARDYLGDEQRILTSTDGQTWQPVETPHLQGFGGLLDVIWDDGQFIAVGDAGAVLTSPDGLAWALRSTGSDLHDVAWNGSFFLAVGVGVAARSEDGKSWEYTTARSGDESLMITELHWTGGLFVGIAQDPGGGSEFIVTSPDGKSWTIAEGTQDSGGHSAIASSPEAIVVAGSTLWRSLDGGATFQSAFSSDFLYDVVWTGTQFVGLGSGVVMTSADGATWQSSPSPLSGHMTGLSWSEADHTLLAWSAADQAMISHDGAASWGVVALPPESSALLDQIFTRLVFANGRFVLIGREGTVLTSEDGSTWTQRTMDDEYVIIEGIAFGNEQTVLVGEGGMIAVDHW